MDFAWQILTSSLSYLSWIFFALENMTQRSFFHHVHYIWPRNLVVNQISWLIGFCNQWTLLYLSVIFSTLFWMRVQYVIQDILKHFFLQNARVVLVCLIPAPILFAMKPKKVRFFVYLGNRQIIGAVLTVLSCHAFELNSPNMLS